MRLVRLAIADLRNLESVDIEVAPGINLFHGANGAGKTSILESLFMLSRGRSFRSPHLHDVVRHGAASCWVNADLGEDRVARLRLSAGVGRSGRRTLKVGEDTVSKLSRIAALLPVQLMSGDASTLVFGSPSWRRQWIDWLLFHVEPELGPSFSRYEQALRQRNSLLRQVRDGNAKAATLVPWERVLGEQGQKIDEARKRLVVALHPRVKVLLDALGQPFDVEFDVSQGWSGERELGEDLAHRRERDVALGHTTSGAHRGDLHIRVAGRPGGRSLSRGQGKAVAAAMILAQFDHLRELGRFDGVLLIDDFSAEFDAEVRDRFVQALGSRPFQVLATGVEALDRPLGTAYSDSASFHVKQGVVYRDG